MHIFKKNFNHILIALAVVLVWRGIWGLADMYLFPANPILSFAASILVGLILLFFIDFKSKDISELN